ncbi:MAG: hypothetical protein KGN84_16330, partial [Acidobacteriota bacterium]|nr:hypothetical protein [Acidobacteriota bacterium]
MQKLYFPVLVASALFLGWAHVHTDEVPIVLGLVLIVSGALGFLYPKQAVLSALVLGPVIFCAETLVYLGVLRAPFPQPHALPWAALVALVPAAVGVAVGAA